MATRARQVIGPLAHYVNERVARWRTGSTESQLWVLGVLLACVLVCFGVSLVNYGLMPLTAYFLWLVVGMLLLRFYPLLVLVAAACSAGAVAMLASVPLDSARTTALVIMALSATVIVYTSSRQRSGLPGPLGEAMLSDLRDRLQAQGKVPTLPGPWRSQSAMLAAHGVGYAGDFLVAQVDDDDAELQMILVDVCGKGVGAATQALQFAGALGGLLGALPGPELMRAANRFLYRQPSDETFATAAHVRLDLRTGVYELLSAGHPPALRWDRDAGAWEVDHARGTALGVAQTPELHGTSGVLAPGEALMFYTDGVVERRDADLDEGIDWLRATGRAALGHRTGPDAGFDGLARRLIKQVAHGDDDRAVLVLWRRPDDVSATTDPLEARAVAPVLHAGPAA